MTYRIGFLAAHPGSVNALTQLVNLYKKCINVDLTLYPCSPYACEAWEVEQMFNPHEVVDVQGIDLMVYSPAHDLTSEITLASRCRDLGITTIAIIDIFFMSDADLTKRFKGGYPDIIITPDGTTADQLIRLQVPSKVLPIGNTHYETFNKDLTYANEFNSMAIISQPKGTDNTCPTDSTIINLCRRIAKHSNEFNTLKEVVVCTHPRESRDMWESLVQEFNSMSQVKFKLNEYADTSQACSNVDVVMGTSSTVLVEQTLKGKPVIFYTNLTNLINQLNDSSWQYNSRVDFNLPTDVLDNTAKLIEEVLRWN